MAQPTIKTLGELKKTDYKFLSIKDELRENLITKLKNNKHQQQQRVKQTNNRRNTYPLG